MVHKSLQSIRAAFLAAVLGVLLAHGPAQAQAAAAGDACKAGPVVGVGVASWYGPGFHGRKTANGERFDMNKLTAAHRLLPLGSRIRVKNVENGETLVVRVNDRGPYEGNRVLDLSHRAAQQLGFEEEGLAKVVMNLCM